MRIKFLLIFISHIFAIKGITQTMSQGVVEIHSNLSSSRIAKDKIWFKDSCVVYEILNSVNTDNGSGVEKHSYEILKYVFLDLKTMRCQDYLSFSDTAIALNNYILRSGETVAWGFFSDAKPRYQDLLSFISDSTMNGIVYKRARAVERNSDWELIYVYYLRSLKSNIFSMNKHLEIDQPGYKTTRLDIIDPRSNKVTTIEIEIIKEQLDSKEERILDRWNDNAMHTKLPLLSLKEAESAFLEKMN